MLSSPPQHRRLQTTPRELRGQLAIFVIVFWAVGVWNMSGAGERLRAGRGTDFLHFFALATVGAEAPSKFADAAFVREAQLRAVPESAPHLYPPVYGPQVGLALAPLARFGYGTALVLWSAVSTIMYLAAVAVALKDSTVVRRYFSIGLLAAVGFPPFWYLLQYGQLSAVALCVIVASAIALHRGHGVWVGVLLGLLVYKPPLFVPILAILTLAGSWAVVAGMLAGGAAELLFSSLWVGVEGLIDYADMVLRLPKMATLMAARPDQMHSLRTFWSLMFGNSAFAAILYAVTAVAAMIAAALVWRRVTQPSLRMGALLLGAVLASPHMYIYDLVILAPVWIWLTDWFLTQQLTTHIGRMLYVGYFAGLLGHLARIIPVQLSVPCFAYLLVSLWWWTRPATTTLPGTSSAGLRRVEA